MKSMTVFLLVLLLLPRLMSETESGTSTRATVDQANDIRLPSPDGRWEVESVAPRTANGNSKLLLKSLPNGHARPLGEFFRSGTLIWSSNSKILVFLDRHSPEDTRVRVFFLPMRGGVVTNKVDREIRDSVFRSIGKGNKILFYDLEVPSCSGDGFLVSVQVATASMAILSGPAKQWAGKYTVRFKPFKVTRESFGVIAEGIEQRKEGH